ncbi:hypothetical protein [Acetobacter pasteurianus]|uniref:hypothetical protein n=1 Tax=Acetobacter pasteurianus TaxID=438 RepID=UPI000B198315|nr:hypothetical protein [Acetobacter pasteurianus]
MSKETLPPPRFLSEKHAKSHATPAPEYLAKDVIDAGLTKKVSDVVVMENGEVYSRFYLQDGTPSSIFLFSGIARSG